MSTIHIYGTIGVDVTPATIARDLNAATGPVTVTINSFGGDAYAGIAIANQLATYRDKVTAIVEGLAASAASIILTGASEVLMYRSSEIMIHEASINIGGNSAELAASSAQLDQLSANMAQAYADFAGGNPEDWRAAMKTETWFTADDAVQAGLVDRIITGKTTEKPAAALTATKTRPPAALLNKEKTMRIKKPQALEEENTIVLDASHIDRLKAALDLEDLDADTLVDTIEKMASKAPAEDPNQGDIADAKAEAQAHWLVHNWIKEGRFSAAHKDKVIRLATIDPQLAMDSYGSRPVNTVPVTEVGYSVVPSEDITGTGKKWVR